MSSDRRTFMKKMGVAGAALGSVSVAGCSSDTTTKNPNAGDNGGTTADKAVEDNLPEDRKVPKVRHFTTTQDYWAERYEAVKLIDQKLTDEIGLPTTPKGLELSAWPEYQQNGRFGFWSSNWSSSDGDPSSQLVKTFTSDGSVNYWGYANKKYDEVAKKQQRETDRKKRQDLVYKAQNILGETRPESQIVHNYRTHAFNKKRIAPDSIVTTYMGLRNVWNYVSMKPLNDEGKTIVTNNFDPTDSINPLHQNTLGNLRNSWAVQLTHDYLYKAGPNTNAKPWAAKGHEWKDDKTISVTLRDDLKSHDGKQVTADDVVFTYKLILDKKPPIFQSFVNDIVDTVEKTGSHEVTFHLPKPYAPILNSTFGRVPILPKHFWKDMMSKTGNSDQPWNVSFSSRKLVGTGPFELTAWDQGSKVVFDAVKDHFKEPKVDRRIERTLSSRQAEVKALQQGKYDMLETWFGSPEKLKNITDGADDLEMVKALADTRMAMWSNCSKPPLNDPAMRQAVNAVVRSSQQTIIEEVFDGIAERARSPISPALKFWYNPKTPVFDGGVNGAIQILKDAGYKWDKQGHLYMPKDVANGN